MTFDEYIKEIDCDFSGLQVIRIDYHNQNKPTVYFVSQHACEPDSNLSSIMIINPETKRAYQGPEFWGRMRWEEKHIQTGVAHVTEKTLAGGPWITTAKIAGYVYRNEADSPILCEDDERNGKVLINLSTGRYTYPSDDLWKFKDTGYSLVRLEVW